MPTPMRNKLYKLQFEKAQDCYVLLYPEGMVKLNPSAAEILLQVDGNNTVDGIISALKAKFPDAPDSISEDIHRFLDEAENKEWIHYEQ
ncbi:pyrroloquinoline quinone biosynthesis peptide chaperone PqqD [Alteromonas sp. C1M14]|uniref:pyrroloquinoline quinone biosynthesis peptide chaperone PqqD n=1 Tax=Alteromonas sp. C1M14 TaxID=2841567 RepID=UPI001C08851B|nr:pyrroloquinoline quinone biosynthesis peptide chaperone PqqD [Alteromonas sp. C1M14]MBU2979263.1 pyrroloquinoline quinone biosynthesis peptide chaperone PqqD [Alteromonas sp. C1M14]